MSFRYADWPLPSSVYCGWTTRESGYSSGVMAGNNVARHVQLDPEVEANRTLLRSRLKGNPNLNWLHQTHSTNVVPLGEINTRIGQDGATTDSVSEACCVMTADCLPVFLWSASGERVAAVHAGWRGLAEGILDRALSAFADIDGVYAGIGPAISQAHFEVGTDVLEAFEHWPGGRASFVPGAARGKYWCDLPGLARSQLLNRGVRQVYGGDQCTYANASQFYSYRRDGVTGRMANLIWKAT